MSEPRDELVAQIDALIGERYALRVERDALRADVQIFIGRLDALIRERDALRDGLVSDSPTLMNWPTDVKDASTDLVIHHARSDAKQLLEDCVLLTAERDALLQRVQHLEYLQSTEQPDSGSRLPEGEKS